jgi:hypothetical protein
METAAEINIIWPIALCNYEMQSRDQLQGEQTYKQGEKLML